MHVSISWWAALVVVVLLLLSIDLVVTRRQQAAPTAREAARWVGFYVSAAVVFGIAILIGFGGEYGSQFFAGWLTEYSLSVDNLFVFMILMARFAVPAHLQLRVLSIGIVLALVLRALLIAVGAAAIERFSWVFLIFGAFLLWTAWGLLRGEADEAELAPQPTVDGVPAAEEGRLVRMLVRVLPTTKIWHGTRITVRERGQRVFTPMLLTMVAIGFTDVLFALDSIPAIFGLTREPFLVIAANAFALLGLRQLYFLVGGLVDRLVYLSKGLSFILAFIGVKLVMEALHTNSAGWINGGQPVEWVPEVPVLLSLGVVIGTLALTAAASAVVTRSRERAQRAAAPVTRAESST